MRDSLLSIMKILTRLLIVVCLLTALGYGSYAFGQHVLSARLFGNEVLPTNDSGMTASTGHVDVSAPVTRKTHITGDKPLVDVEVMPADQAGPGPEAPSIEELQKSTDSGKAEPRSTPSPDAGAAIEAEANAPVPRARDHAEFPVGGDGSVIMDGDKLRHRRRRHKAKDDAAAAAAVATATARDSAGTPDTRDNNSTNETAKRDSPASGVERHAAAASSAPARNDSEIHHALQRPTRRIRSDMGNSSVTRHHSQRASVSPVPRPEGSAPDRSDSGESPIPVPE
jgi:hypothetical protein